MMLTVEARTLEAVIRTVFHDLEGEGFQFYEASVKNTAALGDYVEVLVLSQMTGRNLLFWYIPPITHPEGILVFLGNDKGDTFSLNEFLAHNNFSAECDKSITLANYQGPLEKRFEGVLNSAKTIIFLHLKNCLLGKEWKSIPIQWGDMR